MDMKSLTFISVTCVLFGLISARSMDPEIFLKRAWYKHKLQVAQRGLHAADLAVRAIGEGGDGCPEGFYGADCEKSCACEDVPGYDWACPHWEHLCSDAHFGEFLEEACRSTCHLCNPPPGAC